MTKKLFWQADASPNIALIKYMGKRDIGRNLPDNSSLSYTLSHLYTRVKLTALQENKWEADVWHPGTEKILSREAKARFIRHLQYLKQQFGYTGHFEIFSENNFPAGCGLASSASSFAALTQCALRAFGVEKNVTREAAAALSRQGSGSSCRSFFPAWALWQGDKVTAPGLPYENLLHKVVVVSCEHKSISSSDAHRRVQSSLLYTQRPQRAEARLAHLLKNLQEKNWPAAYQIVWQEFWDMHALFETAVEPFGYMLPGSLAILQKVRAHWEKYHDGPLVTMDAGPNVHLLFREEQKELAENMTREWREATGFLIL